MAGRADGHRLDQLAVDSVVQAIPSVVGWPTVVAGQAATSIGPALTSLECAARCERTAHEASENSVNLHGAESESV